MINDLQPIPTIQPAGVYDDKPSCVPSIAPSRKPPKERIFQPDQLHEFETAFQVDKLGDINESMLQFLNPSFTVSVHDDHAVFYKMETDKLSIPRVSISIRIDSDLRVRLFYKGSHGAACWTSHSNFGTKRNLSIHQILFAIVFCCVTPL